MGREERGERMGEERGGGESRGEREGENGGKQPAGKGMREEKKEGEVLC